MERLNLWSALAAKAAGSAAIANSRHPSSPRGHLSAEAEPVDLLVSDAALSRGGHGGGGVAPAEVGAIDPHAVQDDGQPPGERDDGAPHAPTLRDPHGPGLQP